MVVLPEHLHCIWSLPEGDSDYKTRWGLIKAGFSRQLPGGERRSESRVRRGERGIWQRRYWEHADSRRPRFRAARRLHPLESRQARLGETGFRLAAFEFPCLRAARPLSGGLGRAIPMRRLMAGNDTTNTVPSSPHPTGSTGSAGVGCGEARTASIASQPHSPGSRATTEHQMATGNTPARSSRQSPRPRSECTRHSIRSAQGPWRSVGRTPRTAPA